MAQVKGELERRPRRFYKHAEARPSEGGWGVFLDGKTLRTPAKKLFGLPTEPLARAIAAEWDAQAERIDFAYMHLFRLANVALDRAPETHDQLADEAARYATTDLLCHLADSPAELRNKQQVAWTPLSDWAAETLGVKLHATEGIVPRDQPPASIDAVRRHAAALDDFRLTALVHTIAFFGSAILGLAVERRRITAVEAHDLSRIDEIFQASLWGEDAHAGARAALHREEAAAIDAWFDALA
jgi:chaperone required for assembly of F1-ATPase